MLHFCGIYGKEKKKVEQENFERKISNEKDVCGVHDFIFLTGIGYYQTILILLSSQSYMGCHKADSK
jgi:hypothetical protein